MLYNNYNTSLLSSKISSSLTLIKPATIIINALAYPAAFHQEALLDNSLGSQAHHLVSHISVDLLLLICYCLIINSFITKK